MFCSFCKNILSFQNLAKLRYHPWIIYILWRVICKWTFTSLRFVQPTTAVGSTSNPNSLSLPHPPPPPGYPTPPHPCGLRQRRPPLRLSTAPSSTPTALGVHHRPWPCALSFTMAGGRRRGWSHSPPWCAAADAVDVEKKEGKIVGPTFL
jgi:hypothetical protein